MMVNYVITGVGLLFLSIAGFIVSLQVGFFILGLSWVGFGLIFDMDRL